VDHLQFLKFIVKHIYLIMFPCALLSRHFSGIGKTAKAAEGGFSLSGEERFSLSQLDYDINLSVL
jgi:hypothetical protein